jgi:hypothetical protein
MTQDSQPSPKNGGGGGTIHNNIFNMKLSKNMHKNPTSFNLKMAKMVAIESIESSPVNGKRNNNL